jgi:hypothetical protein
MKRLPRASRGHAHSPKSTRRVLDEMRVKLLDLEVPLNDAIDYVQALRLIGHGLIAEYHDAGSAIVTTAHAASEQLDALKEIWDRTRKIGRRPARDNRRRRRA